MFLSRPRRFGKSLLTSTLHSYFSGRKELFHGLVMEKLEKEWTEYPVLHFDMSMAKHVDKGGLERLLDFMLAEYERTFAINAVEGDANLRLVNLIKRAYEQTGKKVVVLIDEYDADGNLVAKGKVNFGYGQSSKVRKWTRWDRVESEDPTTGCRTGINYRAIRYADVLLMYAEAILEDDGDVDLAIEYIDKVRERAGVVKLKDYITENNGFFPKLWVSKFANNYTDFEMIPANKDNVLMHLRMAERLLELAFEGHRWLDLVRWGLVKECFEQCWSEEQGIRLNLCGSITSTTISSTEQIPPLNVKERVRPDFEMRSKVYQSDVHDYFPIPSCEVQNNKALQN